MKSDESRDRSPAIQTQLGRKRRKVGGTLQRFCASPNIGPPRNDIRPPVARQTKGEYPLVPETVVDLRPPVPQKPLTASALALLELYYRLNTFVMATEEKAPVEWAAERFLSVGETRAYAILLEIDSCGELESWFREKALVGMGRGRIGRGRQTRPSPLADAFFIALAGGVPQAMSCVQCLAGTARAELKAETGEDHDDATAEVRDYMVHSRLLWRLRGDNGE
jgi:hypothetical protein